jgi:hypothetical protein
MKVFNQFLTKRFLVFTTLFLTLQYTSCTTYIKAYTDAVNKLSKTPHDLSVFPNAHINIPIWSFGYVFHAAVLYYFYVKGNDAIAPILVMAFCMYGFWDAFPFMVMQNGYKYMHLWIYDTMITGVVLTFITLYLFKNYYRLLEKNYLLLIFTCITTYLIFFYQWFKLSRTGADNWLVKLGDSLHIDKYARSIRVFK